MAQPPGGQVAKLLPPLLPARLLMETLRISLLGTNRQPLEELIAEAASAYNASQACRTAVHSVDQVGPLTRPA